MPEVRAERAAARVQLGLDPRRLLARDVEEREPVPDRRVPFPELGEVLGRGRPSAPDVRVVALDVVGTARRPVGHHENADRRVGHRSVSSCTSSTRRWRFADGRARQHAVTEVEHVTVALRRASEHLARLGLDGLPRAGASRGVEVALDRAPGSDALPRGVERDTPVHADRVSAGVAHRCEQLPRADPEVDRRDREFLEHRADPRLHGALVVAGFECPHPAVEQLHDLDAGLDLRQQVRPDDAGERVHQHDPRLRLAEHQRLRPRVVARRPTLDEVARQGVRRAGEPDQRDRQLLAQEPDRLEEVGLVGLRLEGSENRDPGSVADRLVDDRPGAGLDPHAQRRPRRAAP